MRDVVGQLVDFEMAHLEIAREREIEILETQQPLLDGGLSSFSPTEMLVCKGCVSSPSRSRCEVHSNITATRGFQASSINGSSRSSSLLRSASGKGNGSSTSSLEPRRVTWADEENMEPLEQEFLIPPRPNAGARRLLRPAAAAAECFIFALGIAAVWWLLEALLHAAYPSPTAPFPSPSSAASVAAAASGAAPLGGPAATAAAAATAIPGLSP